MTHELIKIFERYAVVQTDGKAAVLATVVDLDGSSYRKPGVRMLILENGDMVGAVSGGCVEKEVLRQAQSVFDFGVSKIMTYDGRYRLGCEGTLYILIEPFRPGATLVERLARCVADREEFQVISHYTRAEGEADGLHSLIRFNDGVEYPVSDTGTSKNATAPLSAFVNEMLPCHKMVIVGSEHDAVELCLLASLSGWEVTVISSPSDPKTKADFPGSKEVIELEANDMHTIGIDEQTSVVLMTHNFARDLKYLMAIQKTRPVYLGVLGSRVRKEKLITEFLNLSADADFDFIEQLHGPAGLNIGAITPQEIAISILGEILSVSRKQNPRIGDNVGT